MAKRIKRTATITPIADWQEADKMLRTIGDCLNRISEANGLANIDIDKIKADLIEKTKPLQDEAENLIKSLEAYAVNNQEAFGKARSKQLNFGILGWRKSSSISISKKNTLDLIKEIFKRKVKVFIAVKETVKKDALKALTDEQLASIGAKRKSKDVFFAEPDLTKVKEY